MNIRLEIACVEDMRDVYYSFNQFTMKNIIVELDAHLE